MGDLHQPAPTGPLGPFELSGGALCLDFANTWGDRGRPESEGLHSYRELVAFALQAEALESEEAEALLQQAGWDAEAAEQAFAEARRLRESLYRLFSARAAGRRPPAGDLERLNAYLPEALAGLRLAPKGEGYAWRGADGGEALTSALRPVVRSAAELLTSSELDRVRECDGASCTWLFLDRSRNRSRRWCSMESCGNRAKARRHYHRHAKETG
jgi:predicted RNA-binding Zn ribbon-like protein